MHFTSNFGLCGQLLPGYNGRSAKEARMVTKRDLSLVYLSLNMSQNTTWLIIRHRSNLHILSLHYFIIHNPFTPTYLKKWFNLMGANMTSQLQLRLRSDSQLMLPTTHTRFYGDFFSKKQLCTTLEYDHFLNSSLQITTYF